MPISKVSAFLAGLLLSSALAAPPTGAGERFITVASTTSTQNAGLFDFILPKFTAKTGIEVRVVAVGTGQAIRLARHGDADVLFVHDMPSEVKFVAEGFGTARRDVMMNDFVVVGPESDSAAIAGIKDVAAAFAKIARVKAAFVSRGDDSGTHRAEKRIWKAAGIEPEAASGTWYRETGSGMGQCLNISAAIDGYTLTDRGTWLSFENKGDLRILVEGDPGLFNQYGVTMVNPAKFPHVKKEDAMAFIDWLTSPQGQRAIADFRIGGEQLFFPNAG